MTPLIVVAGLQTSSAPRLICHFSPLEGLDGPEDLAASISVEVVRVAEVEISGSRRGWAV